MYKFVLPRFWIPRAKSSPALISDVTSIRLIAILYSFPRFTYPLRWNYSLCDRIELRNRVSITML